MAKLKVTKPVRQTIEEALLKGDASFEHLAWSNGVSVPTLYAWFPGGPRKYALARRWSKQLGIPAKKLIDSYPGNYVVFSAAMEKLSRAKKRAA
jgi:hypothetical protein